MFVNMFSNFLPLCQFKLRLLIQQSPISAAMLCLSAAAFLLASTSYFSQRRIAITTDQQHQVLTQKLVAMRTAQSVAVTTIHPKFKEFDSAQLVGTLAQKASQAQLPLAEISYTLDENANLPYLRYRAMLTVNANYLTIRSFVDQVLDDLADVSLDNISCIREDLKSVTVKCELAFSAFYNKPHG